MPVVVFETARLRAVNPAYAHVPHIHGLFNDEVNNPSYGFKDWTEDMIKDLVTEWLADLLPSPRQAFRLVIEDRKTGAFIGYANTHHITGLTPYPEIGVNIASDKTGCGYAKEIAQGLIHLAFAHFNYAVIGAYCSPDNLAPIKMLKDAGFRLTELRKQDFHNGRDWEDTLVWLKDRQPL